MLHDSASRETSVLSDLCDRIPRPKAPEGVARRVAQPRAPRCPVRGRAVSIETLPWIRAKIASDLRNEDGPELAQLLVSHAAYSGKLAVFGGVGARHLPQGHVREDNERGHALLIGQLLAQSSQALEQGFVACQSDGLRSTLASQRIRHCYRDRCTISERCLAA